MLPVLSMIITVRLGDIEGGCHKVLVLFSKVHQGKKCAAEFRVCFIMPGH